jgi:hypothetical protein
MRRIPLLLLLTSTALWLASCVELEGQRISFFHDQAKDELRVLIFYDGIHDSGENGNGVEQLPEFVKNGDILLLDWIGHVERDRIQGAADDAESLPAKRALAQASLAITSRPIGHYRDGSGEIGAAQLVVIPRVSEWLKKLNAFLDEAVQQQEPTGWRRTNALWKEVGKRGHTWVSLDGHAIRVRIPIDHEEWTITKAEGLAELLNELVSVDDMSEFKATVRMLAQAIASVPLAYEEADGEVRIRIGDPKRPSTLRFTLRDEYQPNLEGVVTAEVPAALSPAVGQQVLGQPQAGAAIADVIAWGPPEEAARGLFELSQGHGEAAAAAKQKLDAWAVTWNQTHAHRRAPDAGATADAWREWFRQMRYYPAEAPAATQPAGQP